MPVDSSDQPTRSTHTVSDFSVGDRVVCIAPPDNEQRLVGSHGTVTSINPNPAQSLPILVEFNRDSDYLSTWWCEPETLLIEGEAMPIPPKRRYIPISRKDTFEYLGKEFKIVANLEKGVTAKQYIRLATSVEPVAFGGSRRYHTFLATKTNRKINKAVDNLTSSNLTELINYFENPGRNWKLTKKLDGIA